VPSDIPLTKEVLTQMGFTYADPDDHHGPGERHRRVIVDLKKTAIDLWSLASARDGDDRPNDAQMAQVMGTLIQQLLANPLTAQAIGAHQAIMFANQIAQLAGLPRDFKLIDMTPQGQPASPEEQQAAAQQQLQGLIQQILPPIDQHLQQELTPLLEQVKQNSDAINQLSQLVGAANHPANDQLVQPPSPGPNGAPNPGMVAPTRM